MISRKDVSSTMAILITSVFAVTITLMTSNPAYHVVALWSLVLVAIFVCKFDPLHPYFWFSSSFALYTSAYTIILMLGFRSNVGYSYENTLISIIALTTTLLTIGPKKNEMEEIVSTESSYTATSNVDVDKRVLRNILIILFIILIISVMFISRLGIQRKSELVSNRYLSFRVATYAVRYVSLYCCLYIVTCGKKLKPSPVIFLCGMAILLFTLFTAERDGIFRFLLIIVCAMFATQRLSRKTLPIIFGIGLMTVVAVSYLKYFFVDGSVRVDFAGNSIIYNFLASDFTAAGQNMQVLLNNPWTKSYKNYLLILNDFLAPFAFGNIRTFNISSWYNDVFYYGSSYSRAFTLVGEGYVIDGYLGVIVLFIIVGLLVRMMYRKSKKNKYWLTAYIYTISTVASSFRGALRGIVVDLVRIVLVGIVAYILLRALIITRQRTKLCHTRFARYTIVGYGNNCGGVQMSERSQ